MGRIEIRAFNGADQQELNRLYEDCGEHAAAFGQSFLTAVAVEDGTVCGAARALSEGVETALLADLRINSRITEEAQRRELKKQLVEALEAGLNDRRIMVYGTREELDFWEEAGYGRCKNAWTFLRPELSEKEFLPAGYRFESEFFGKRNGDGGEKVRRTEQPKTPVTYRFGTEQLDFSELNELLTQAFFGHPHQTERTRKAFLQSHTVITAYEGDRLVGTARAVSDGTQYANILNVAVHPDYQGRSIGRELVVRLAEAVPAKRVVLNTHPGAVGFYNRLREFRRNKYIFEKQRNGGMDPERAGAMFTPKGYRFPEEY